MRASLIIGIAFTAAAGLGAQDPIGAARDLYASAAYEEALSALSRVDGGSTTPEIARQADEYRAFCLFALGRTREAESIAESLIRKEPLMRLDAGDASPRLERMFSDVRQRLLPSLIRERFRSARFALDQKSFSGAEPLLIEASLMIVEAENLGVKDEGLGDLSVLVDGFLQLIRTAAEQRVSQPPAAAKASASTAEPAVAPPPIAPPPIAPSPAPSAPATSSAPAAASGPATVSAGAAGEPRVYSIEDVDVTPPVVIDQRLPAMPAEMILLIKAMRATGMVDVVIDETGKVIDVMTRQTVNAGFDAMIIRSARRWKYEPAMKDGVPVRYIKTLALVP